MSHGSLLGEIGSVGSRIELDGGSGISHTITDIYVHTIPLFKLRNKETGVRVSPRSRAKLIYVLWIGPTATPYGSCILAYKSDHMTM